MIITFLIHLLVLVLILLVVGLILKLAEPITGWGQPVQRIILAIVGLIGLLIIIGRMGFWI